MNCDLYKQATREGQVKHISVKENQMVKKGDVIATIDVRGSPTRSYRATTSG
nr:biotin/lipoyl-binding protein [Coleofasciculus sp. LEGE 07092]